jgi:hypothetical protein
MNPYLRFAWVVLIAVFCRGRLFSGQWLARSRPTPISPIISDRGTVSCSGFSEPMSSRANTSSRTTGRSGCC